MKEYYEKQAVSNSEMSSINPEQGGSPARYKKYVIDREKEEGETPSLENGKLIHLYVEDPKAFIVSDVDKPAVKLSGWVEQVFALCNESWDKDYVTEDNLTLKKLAVKVMPKYGNTTDEDKLWKVFQGGFDYLKHLFLANNELCITSKQKEIVENCIASLRNHKLASELLFQPGEEFGDKEFNELAIYWKLEVSLGPNKDVRTTLDCKALLDRVKITGTKVTLVDLKTTGKPVAQFKNSFEYYRYYRQMGWYLIALSKYLKEKDPLANWEYEVYMVVVETSYLHETKVFKVTDDYLKKGIQEASDLLKRIAHCTYTDDWSTSMEELETNYIELTPDECVKI